jgi:hypothetical protein
LRDFKPVSRRPIYLLLLIPLFFIVYPLTAPGVVDATDFPFPNTLKVPQVFWMWMENGSYNSFEVVTRFPIIGTLYFFAILGVTPDVLSKLMIILGFLGASFSFYFAFVRLFEDRLPFRSDILKLEIVSVLGSLFYAYNVWSFSRVSHWYLWLGYCLLPLFFMSVIYAFRGGLKWKYVLLAVTIWSVASSFPQMIIFYGLVFLIASLYFILRNLGKRETLYVVGKSASLIIILYVLVNMFWIYPYILTSRSATIAPTTIVSEETTELLSRDSNFLNVFRLVQDWVEGLPGHEDPTRKVPASSPLYPLWLFASFSFPALAFLSLMVTGNARRYALGFTSLALVGIFLVVGNQSQITDHFYSLLLFQVPIVSSFDWLFREPDKWSFLIAFGYSFCLTISAFEILKFFRKIRYYRLASFGFLMAVLGSLVIYSYPVYKTTFEERLNPIELPTDFEILNAYLSQVVKSDRVFHMPYGYDDSFGWRQGHGIRTTQYSSSSPNIQISQLGTQTQNIKNYYNFWTNAVYENKTADINNFIYPFGTSYIVYENVTDPGSVAFLKKLHTVSDVSNIDNVGFFNIFNLTANSKTGQVGIPKQNIVMSGGLDKFLFLNSIKPFDSVNSSVTFLDQNIDKEKYRIAGKYADFLSPESLNSLALAFVEDRYLIKPFDVVSHAISPDKTWSKARTTDPLHGDFHIYLENFFRIDNSDFDYEKGVVLTWAKDSIQIPIEIKKTGDYNLYIRLMKNQAGGGLVLSLDDNPLKEIITKSQLNTFEWYNIGERNLSEGRHVLTLENVEGLNVVNVLAAIPVEETEKLFSRAVTLGNAARNVYVLDAESRFHSRGNETSRAELFTADMDTKDSRTFSGQFRVPGNTNMTSLQFVADKSNTNTVGQFIIKHLEVRPLIRGTSMSQAPAFLNNFDNFENINTDTQKMTANGNSLETKILTSDADNSFRDDPSRRLNVIQTEPFLVIPDMVYNYSITVEGDNIDSFQARASFLKENLEQFTRALDSDRKKIEQVVALAPESEVFSKVDILKPSNYTVAIRAKLCGTCGSLSVTIGGKEENLSLASRVPRFQWINYTAFLNEGENKLRLYSDTGAEIESVLLISHLNASRQEEGIEELFVPMEDRVKITSYEKINPTKHMVKVDARKPYILSFAEAYDPLWTVSINGTPAKSFPLYSIVNGFLIDKTGIQTLTIEYDPQEWFYSGLAISIATLIFLPIGYILYRVISKSKLRVLVQVSTRRLTTRGK